MYKLFRAYPGSAILLALLAALALAFGACGDDDSDSGESPGAATETSGEDGASPSGDTATPSGDFPLTVVDSNGKTVELAAKPEKIVALAPSFVEVLFALGEGNSIVAADENTDYPPEAEDIPTISGFEPSVEDIASYEADLVLLFFDPGGLQEALDGLGIPNMLLATPNGLDAVYNQIELIGRIVGKDDEATNLNYDMQTSIQDLTAQLGDITTGLRVYHELDSGLFTIGPGSFMHEAYLLLKAQNIAESTGEAFPQMSNEAIIAADPEMIILGDAEFGESAETVAARPGWDAISAVQNDRVYAIETDLLSRPGPRIVNGMQELAALLYPDRFSQ